MTDFSDWPSCVFVMRRPSQDAFTSKESEYFFERIMVPLNEYQLGNLVDAIAQVPNTGDWWGEFCLIAARAMRVAGLKQVRSNRGNTYTLEQVANQDIRPTPSSQRSAG